MTGADLHPSYIFFLLSPLEMRNIVVFDEIDKWAKNFQYSIGDAGRSNWRSSGTHGCTFNTPLEMRQVA